MDLENRLREENMQKLVKKLSDEIGKFHEMLQYERKLREETQTTMFRMIEDIHSKVMYDL